MKAVLLFSDRLIAETQELARQIEEKTDMSVLGVFSEYSQAAGMLTYSMDECARLDYLVICGYLEHKENYMIVDFVKHLNPSAKIVHHAIPDGYIQYEDKKYGIPYCFDRFRPVEEFIQYLKEIKSQD